MSARRRLGVPLCYNVSKCTGRVFCLVRKSIRFGQNPWRSLDPSNYSILERTHCHVIREQLYKRMLNSDQPKDAAVYRSHLRGFQCRIVKSSQISNDFYSPQSIMSLDFPKLVGDFSEVSWKLLHIITMGKMVRACKNGFYHLDGLFLGFPALFERFFSHWTLKNCPRIKAYPLVKPPLLFKIGSNKGNLG